MSTNGIIATAYLTFIAAVLTLALAPIDRAPFRFMNRAMTDIWYAITRMLGVDALNRRFNQRRALDFIDLAERAESAGLHDPARRLRTAADRLIAGD